MEKGYQERQHCWKYEMDPLMDNQWSLLNQVQDVYSEDCNDDEMILPFVKHDT